MEPKVIKYSRQREAIWDYIKNRKDHPTADTVYTYVKKVYPNISLATVYRNLMLLNDMGKLRTVFVGDGMVHFAPDTSDHDHFLCTKCGKVTDIYFDGKEETVRKPLDFEGKIERSFTIYKGICEQCLKKSPEI